MLLILLAACDRSDGDSDGLDTGCPATSWYVDADGDGFGGEEHADCDVPVGAVDVGGDCDDDDESIHPGATELCDGIDRDCDGTVSEETTLYVDSDGDGWGDAEVISCPASGLADLDGDCNDEDAEIHPEAEEIPYDGIDQDCIDGDLDDVDGDGARYGDDCDDDDARRHPWSIETCGDGVDNDCNDIAEDCAAFDGTGVELRALIWGARAESGVSGGGAWAGAGGLAGGLDVDGDGHPDIVLASDEVDALGEAHLVLGPFQGERTMDTSGAHAGPFGEGARPTDVSISSDLTGDGTPDWIIGVENHDYWGSGWVVDGELVGTQLHESSFQVDAERSEYAADSVGTVVGAADLDGDGISDAWFTGPQTETWEGAETGGIFIFSGPMGANGSTLDADTTIAGPTGTGLGAWAHATDVTGDGLADMVIGATADEYGSTPYEDAVYVLHGPITGATFGAPDCDGRIGVPSARGQVTSVTSGGDLNGDGLHDIAIATAGDTPDTIWLHGAPSSNVEIDDAPTSILEGSVWAIGTATDTNSDGVAELIAGSQESVTEDRGALRLYLGPLTSGSLDSSSAADTVYGGETRFECGAGPNCWNRGSNLGYAIADMGDLNGEGFGDFGVAAPSESWDPDLHGPGVVYLFFGGE